MLRCFERAHAAGGVFAELFMSAEHGSSPHSPEPVRVGAGAAGSAGGTTEEIAAPHSPGGVMVPAAVGDIG